jgi:gamma-glutamyltranspeptidase/glutathione hydrolase
MNAAPSTTPMLRRTAFAALLACCASCALVPPAAMADGGDETPGVARASGLPAIARGTPPGWTGQAFRQGVVTAANPYGAEAGARVLEQGGNAIDAAVAIAYALNVVEPQSAGIGGGGFMMIHLAGSGQTITVDSREKAPAGALRDMFVGVPNASLQGVAVGVPGMVRGTALALQNWGRLPLAQVLQPAIELADQGFAATPRYSAVSCNARSRNSPLSEAYFCPNNGAAVAPGTLVRNEPLAETLRLIAAHGPDCFYRHMPDKGCDIALGIVEGQTFAKDGVIGGQTRPGKGGTMTLADLETYAAVLRAPVEGTYRGWRIKSMAPPSSGALTVLQILKMVERFPVGDAAQGFGFGSPATLNVMAESMRLAFADRRDWMGDNDFITVPVKGLTSEQYLAGRSLLIQPGAVIAGNAPSDDPRPFDMAGLEAEPMRDVALAEPSLENGTTHFSVVDQWGNVVSYTNTIESSHGIGVFAGYKRADGSFRNHGFLLNNELTDFNTTPVSHPYVANSIGANDVQAGKRPRSSMAPTMLFAPDGRPILAYGSPGGATIINSVVNITMNLIDHGMSLQQAIDAARISVASPAASVQLEGRFPAATIQAMRDLKYTVTTGDVGSVQAVLIDQQTGKQYGGADDRREGTVIGLPRPQGR